MPLLQTSVGETDLRARGPEVVRCVFSEQAHPCTDAPVVLGPDPVIGPQTIVIQRSGADGGVPPVTLATDGLRPFSVEAGS